MCSFAINEREATVDELVSHSCWRGAHHNDGIRPGRERNIGTERAAQQLEAKQLAWAMD